ncbi:hypothetical protein K438DRAFT_1758809 [Mycena galopus ATCC 62051]|nr:hypothetical protein K438DRAFT_1758809 [Mycena galopus ATCC 62051]
MDEGAVNVGVTRGTPPTPGSPHGRGQYEETNLGLDEGGELQGRSLGPALLGVRLWSSGLHVYDWGRDVKGAGVGIASLDLQSVSQEDSDGANALLKTRTSEHWHVPGKTSADGRAWSWTPRQDSGSFYTPTQGSKPGRQDRGQMCFSFRRNEKRRGAESQSQSIARLRIASAPPQRKECVAGGQRWRKRVAEDEDERALACAGKDFGGREGVVVDSKARFGLVLYAHAGF